jgi:hypothetical protein
MILMRVDGAYPGTDLEPTSVVFVPIGLGDDPEAVHAAFSLLLTTRDFFEVEAVGEPWPVPFYTRRRWSGSWLGPAEATGG